MGCTALVWVGTRTFSIPAYLQKVAVPVSALWRKAGAVLLTTFREKFDTTDERWRSLNSASSLGNARGHVPWLPAAGWKVSISTTGSSRMAWNEALCPSWHTVTQFSLCQLCQTRQHRFLGTSTSHVPLRDIHFETGHWIYQLPCLYPWRQCHSGQREHHTNKQNKYTARFFLKSGHLSVSFDVLIFQSGEVDFLFSVW